MTHFSLINCSVMSETVLRWSPEIRAKSAREIGWRRRIKFKTIPRLMSRAVPLVATCECAKVMGCILSQVWRRRAFHDSPQTDHVHSRAALGGIASVLSALTKLGPRVIRNDTGARACAL